MPRLARPSGSVVRASTQPQGALGEQQFRPISLLSFSLSLCLSPEISILDLLHLYPVKPRARDIRYYKAGHENGRAPTRKSLARVPSHVLTFCFPSATVLLGAGPFSGLPYLGRERRARVTHPKVSGRVRLSGLPAAHAANAGERSPWAARPVSTGYLPRFLHCR